MRLMIGGNRRHESPVHMAETEAKPQKGSVDHFYCWGATASKPGKIGHRRARRCDISFYFYKSANQVVDLKVFLAVPWPLASSKRDRDTEGRQCSSQTQFIRFSAVRLANHQINPRRRISSAGVDCKTSYLIDDFPGQLLPALAQDLLVSDTVVGVVLADLIHIP